MHDSLDLRAREYVALLRLGAQPWTPGTCNRCLRTRWAELTGRRLGRGGDINGGRDSTPGLPAGRAA